MTQFTEQQTSFLENHSTTKRFKGAIDVVKTNDAFQVDLPEDHVMAYFPVPSRKANIDFEEGVRKSDSNFYFDRDALLLALACNALGLPVMYTGPTGCGKSDFFLEFHARLGLPALRVQSNPELDYDDLMGSKGLQGGETRHERGILAFARLHNVAVCVDEVDSLREGTQIALNGYFENKSPISLTGAEFNLSTDNVIQASGFQSIWATSNTGGKEEARAGFGGTGAINKAVLDRMIHGQMDYLPAKVEREILMAKSGQNPMFVDGAIQTATVVRNAYKRGDGIDTTVSTRGLLDWCLMEPLLGKDAAFKGCILEQCEDSERKAFLDAYKTGMAQTHSVEKAA